MNELRKYRRYSWRPLPAVTRWQDTLPDFSRRLLFRKSTVSITRLDFFAHVGAVLQSLYAKSRKAWNEANPERDSRVTK